MRYDKLSQTEKVVFNECDRLLNGLLDDGLKDVLRVLNMKYKLLISDEKEVLKNEN